MKWEREGLAGGVGLRVFQGVVDSWGISDVSVMCGTAMNQIDRTSWQ